MPNITETLAGELRLPLSSIEAAIRLLDGGATVPFIARYRKEQTGAMDDNQLRELEVRLLYLRELEERRAAILKSIEEQNKLSPELRSAILGADTKTRLEDLYLPYKPKRRTKGQIAIEAGLEPLANALYENPELIPETEAQHYLNKDKNIPDIKTALEGAKYILMERFAEDAELIGHLRDYVWEHGRLEVNVAPDKETEGAKFRDYFAYSEPLKKIPAHRMLAILRGRKENILRSSIEVSHPESANHPCEEKTAVHFKIINRNRPADAWLEEVVRWTWRIKLSAQLETDLMLKLRQSAEEEAINVFAANLKDLLLAAPAGARTTMGLDPGYRTGVKVAVVDKTGKILDHTAIYPHAPQNRQDEAIAVLAVLCNKHQVELISIGNGTASRETDQLAFELIKRHPELKLSKIVVNEAGASVYSASKQGAEEFPDLDVTLRGAISIARRLQDPLAELVKIEPKSIGVGQYQHDVNQTQLARSLDNVVEDCVNAVGVDLNTASAALLSRVSGLNTRVAHNIVQFREKNNGFKNRRELLNVPKLGEKVFEQAAGFLRVRGGNPLDASSVHPEAYVIVEDIAKQHQRDIRSLVGDTVFLRSLNAMDYVNGRFGELTVKDIIKELHKPGRDPRPEFKTATFKDGIDTLNDLKPDMILEGVVTNVTNFGAFVDIGVHQDGLVHISALAHQFVKDPRSVVKAGDIVKVKVIEIDSERKRISLSMRLDDNVSQQPSTVASQTKSHAKKRNNPQAEPKPSGALADALLNALKRK